MNTNPPASSAEEGAVSAPLEKLPKLNLPPKPILANTSATPPSVPAPDVAPAVKPSSEPPSMPVNGASSSAPPQTPVDQKKSESPDLASTNKKRPTLSLRVAMIAFVVALLGLIIQIMAFLNLF